LNTAQRGAQKVLDQVSRASQLNLAFDANFGLGLYRAENTIQVTQKCSNSGLELSKSVFNRGFKLADKLSSIRSAIQKALNGLEQVIDNSVEVSNDTVDRVEDFLEVCLLQISYFYSLIIFLSFIFKKVSSNMQISHREKGITLLIIVK